MKKKILSIQFAFLILIPLFLNAQKKIEVTQENVTMSKGNQPAYKVIIPEANLDIVTKEWTKLIRQDTKSKVEVMGSELNITGTLIKEIYQEPFNIYSALVGADSAVKLFAVFEIDSMFFTAGENNNTLHGEKTDNAIKVFIRNFAVSQYKTAVQDKVDNEEKKLSKLNKEFEDLTKQVESDRKEIKENEQNIKNSQDAIAAYEKDNERKAAEIDAKKEANAIIKDDPELLKVAKNQLKDLEKEKSTIENNLEKEQKNIIKYQANIDELNRAIENNLITIEHKKIEITNQEAIVKEITAIFNGIK
jgi:hypothetical protein